ncbi:30S ribosomal protein S8 [Patescibacteria group bacterium]|nr:30S ribosomal protein S8 [Patescibacteria group bacterium]MBU0776805.1 30S ribosomal protein S8 [Patescibacteria group bacterium]MBU0845620.1 30S ribosomal protein S8 [Patescibacteria group bacterium]MBU0922662.1 30S ribosomal protein S8 [Patescibacteria group bacterium]MBU1066713.1 30S ribosomal protein S8 [Patescibacteria group bacterium]
MTNINYSIGDFLIRIKNTTLARKKEMEVDNTKLIESVAEVLKKEGILTEVKKKDGKLIVKPAYRKKEPILMDLKLVSKPGLRIYMGADELSAIRGPSFFILSTSKGALTSREAIKQRIGGEVIVEIW